MRIYKLVLMVLIGWVGSAIVGYSQEELILSQGSGAPGETIKGRVSCATPDGTTRKVKCPTISQSESQACPTGPCLLGVTGCIFYPANGKAKESQRIQKNDSAEYDYPYNAPKDAWGRQVEERPNSRVICYEEYQCSCEVDVSNQTFCKSARSNDVVIAEYAVSNRPCKGIFRQTNEPGDE